MELSELYATGPSDDPQKLITLQYLTDNSAGGGAGVGLNGTSYIFVQANGTPSENASNLIMAYDEASNMIPAPSVNNIVTLILAPGKYTFGTGNGFNIYKSYLNVVSLTGNADVFIDSIYINAEYGTNGSIYVKGINTGTNQFNISDGMDNLVCENCVGLGDSSFGGVDLSGTFINCTGGFRAFGSGKYPPSTSAIRGIASGTFIRCTGGDESFGGDEYGTATGTFINCVGGNYSFGSKSNTFSGNAIYCIGGSSAFYNSSGPSFSGKVNYCMIGNPPYNNPFSRN